MSWQSSTGMFSQVSMGVDLHFLTGLSQHFWMVLQDLAGPWLELWPLEPELEESLFFWLPIRTLALTAFFFFLGRMAPTKAFLIAVPRMMPLLDLDLASTTASPVLSDLASSSASSVSWFSSSSERSLVSSRKSDADISSRADLSMASTSSSSSSSSSSLMDLLWRLPPELLG